MQCSVEVTAPSIKEDVVKTTPKQLKTVIRSKGSRGNITSIVSYTGAYSSIFCESFVFSRKNTVHNIQEIRYGYLELRSPSTTYTGNAPYVSMTVLGMEIRNIFGIRLILRKRSLRDKVAHGRNQCSTKHHVEGRFL